MTTLGPEMRHIVLMLIGEHRDGWMTDFYVTSFKLAQAVVDGRIDPALIASYPEQGPAPRYEYPIPESERLAALAGVPEASEEDIGISVQAITGLMTGDIGMGDVQTWGFYDHVDVNGVDVFTRLGTTERAVQEAVRGLSVTEAAAIVSEASRYWYDHR